jgi:predicted Zn-dependent peptidase
MLWIAQIFHDSATSTEQVLAAFDSVVARIQQQGVDQATLDRALIKTRSALYANIEQFAGFGRANLLASFALSDDDPGRINRLEDEFAKVTPALLQKTANEYLRPTNRTVYVITPGAPAAAAGADR